jgi:hypothetical protein
MIGLGLWELWAVAPGDRWLITAIRSAGGDGQEAAEVIAGNAACAHNDVEVWYVQAGLRLLVCKYQRLGRRTIMRTPPSSSESAPHQTDASR